MTVLDHHPEALADRADPADALAALKRTKTLTEVQRETLDYALAYWVLQTVERFDDLEGIHVLDQLCAAAMRRSDGDATFAARLLAWRALLENKRLSIETRRAGGRTARLRQRQPILDLLRNGPVKQVELAQALGLTAGRISQILAVMEDERHIQRTRRGQENWVSLPQADAAAAPRPVASKAGLVAPGALPRLGGLLIEPTKRVANG